MNALPRDPNHYDDTAPASFPSSPPVNSMPEWYPELLESVTSRVSMGRTQAVRAVNQELIHTYWAMGRDIVERQEMEGWGSKVIDRLSADLRQ